VSHILFCVTPTPGHVNPLILLAKHLRSRRHSILFQTAEVFKGQIEAAGLEFAAFQGLANHDYRESKKIWPELATAEPGVPQLNAYMRMIADRIFEQYPTLQKILDTRSVDLILTDFLFMGSFPLLLDPHRKRPPLITFGVTPVLLRTPETSPFTGNAVRTILADPCFQRRAKELKVHFSHYNARETTAKIVEAGCLVRRIHG
jgi:UDP:flavonoid glycosyltransferase YjiC (YdhE family)